MKQNLTLSLVIIVSVCACKKQSDSSYFRIIDYTRLAGVERLDSLKPITYPYFEIYNSGTNRRFLKRFRTDEDTIVREFRRGKNNKWTSLEVKQVEEEYTKYGLLVLDDANQKETSFDYEEAGKTTLLKGIRITQRDKTTYFKFKDGVKVSKMDINSYPNPESLTANAKLASREEVKYLLKDEVLEVKIEIFSDTNELIFSSKTCSDIGFLDENKRKAIWLPDYSFVNEISCR